jgi:phosphoribosyl-AMP cyclohydrolase
MGENQGDGKSLLLEPFPESIMDEGETSGHHQVVREVFIDCDGDALLLKVEQRGGGACHTGYRSCFHRMVRHGKVEVVGQKAFDPKEVYEK